MTPIYLNPPPPPFPLLELKEDQHLQLFSTPHHDAASSHSSCPIIFNIAQDQRESNPRESQQHEQKADKYISHGGSSDRQVFPSSSVKPVVNDSNNGHKLSVCKREDADENMSDNGSLKWMSSKMRLMRKMNSICTGTDEPVRIVQKFHDHQQQDSSQINSSNNSNETIRVCTDCNTTKTPLWRSGPQGPKSLCNACGIRQRKARRAMAAAAAAAAANGTVLANDTSSTRTKVHKKEKKLRTNCVAQYKKQCKLHSPPHSRKKVCFEDFALSMSKNSAFQRVFPEDEEEAAILLMALSCGLIHS